MLKSIDPIEERMPNTNNAIVAVGKCINYM